MTTTTPDKTIDKCSKCGKSIRYDREDGYWDNLVMRKGTIEWTPFNCINDKNLHEPTNHRSDEKGYYHPIGHETTN